MILLNDLELDRVLAQLPADLLLQIRMLLAADWSLEAERLVARYTGDSLLGKEVIASMTRRTVRG